MTTSTFEGFQIKGIDEERIPDPREAGLHYVSSQTVDFRRYTVYLILEPVAGSDDAAPASIDSGVREIWGQFFNEVRFEWLKAYEDWWKDAYPEMPLPDISLEYCDNGNCGEICVQQTHLDEIEEWHQNLRHQLVAETNKRTLTNFAEREALRDKVKDINSRCFS